MHHAFFPRKGGVSEGIYASLNCGLGSDDDPAHVLENRRLCVASAGLGEAALVTCHQVHSAQVVRVMEPWDSENAPQADALVCARPGIAIGVLTADCAPVLFADTAAGVVGAAHAGWKGAVDGVLEATVDEMVDMGAQRSTLRVAVGPCIHQPSYEVGEEICAEVLTKSPWARPLFLPSSREGCFLFDLPEYVEERLKRAGLSEIHVFGADTYVDEKRYFSYRRTTHQGGGDYGRQLSVIGLGA